VNTIDTAMRRLAPGTPSVVEEMADKTKKMSFKKGLYITIHIMYVTINGSNDICNLHVSGDAEKPLTVTGYQLKEKKAASFTKEYFIQKKPIKQPSTD